MTKNKKSQKLLMLMSDELYERLKKASSSTRLPMAEIVRVLLDAGLDHFVKDVANQSKRIEERFIEHYSKED